MLQGPQEALALGKSHAGSLCCVIYNGAWLTFSLETLLLQTLKPPTVSAIQRSTNYGLNEADKLLQIAGSVCLLLHYLVSSDRCVLSSSYGGQPWQGHTQTFKKKEKDEERSLVSVQSQVLYVNFVFDQQNILSVRSGLSQNINELICIYGVNDETRTRYGK